MAAEWVLVTGQTAAMICTWEGNRGSSVALAMRSRLTDRYPPRKYNGR